MPEDGGEGRSGLNGARIVLGVCGGIAAYKAAELASTLVKAGSIVDVVLTDGGQRFVQPLTFEGLTHRRVWSGVFEGWDDGHTGHVSLAKEADLLLIAPATANAVARLAHGMANDMLAAVALATRAPIVLAPAMEHQMWNHPATVANIETLRNRGVAIVGPEPGRLASGAIGDGRLSAIGEIVWAARVVLGRGGPMAGWTVVITAGGTREAIDPVRYIGNRSSGNMGIALAGAAIDAGATVHLIATPSVDPDLLTGDAQVIESALDMQQAVNDLLPCTDVLIMAAAVADFRPESAQTHKIKKRAGQESLDLHLVRNPDILAGVRKDGLLKVGFAAETEQIVANALQKLASKNLDLIVANDAVATIGSDVSAATLIGRDREPRAIPAASKPVVATAIMSEIVRLLQARERHA